MNLLEILFYVIILIVVSVIVYIGTIQLNKPQKYVDLLRARDGRGKSLKVVSETDLGLECKKTDNITHTFIKIGRGWTFENKGRMITRFFGMEATPYTARVDGPITEEIEQKDYLRSLWGDKFYEALPQKQKQKIEDNKLGVTLKVVDSKEMENLPPLAGNNIADEEEDGMLRRLARMTSASDKAPKMSLMTIGGLIAFGAFAMYFLMTRGVI